VFVGFQSLGSGSAGSFAQGKGCSGSRGCPPHQLRQGWCRSCVGWWVVRKVLALLVIVVLGNPEKNLWNLLKCGFPTIGVPQIIQSSTIFAILVLEPMFFWGATNFRKHPSVQTIGVSAFTKISTILLPNFGHLLSGFHLRNRFWAALSGTDLKVVPFKS